MIITVDIPDEMISMLQTRFGVKIEDAIFQLVKNEIYHNKSVLPKSNVPEENDLISKGLNEVDPRAKKILEEMRSKDKTRKNPKSREIIHLAGSTL